MMSISDISESLKTITTPIQQHHILRLISRRPTTPLAWNNIIPLNQESLLDMSLLSSVPDTDTQELLRKVAIVKLNGGLGTGMVLSSSKSSLTAKNTKSFLELIIQQIRSLNQHHSSSVPLVLMNSESTQHDTLRVISRFKDIDILCFKQNFYPRLDFHTMLPIATTPSSPPEYWYPPGHGDIYESIFNSGTLDLLQKRGINILFISNSDNLGATMDLRLLNSFIHSQSTVMVEVTPKTPADTKGGTFILYREDGSPKTIYRDLEVAQVPPEHLADFQSPEQFPFFNTGNLWIKVDFLIKTLKEQTLHLDVIENKKMVGDRQVLQLETAAGSIVSSCEHVDVVCVPRSRFIPVKRCSDLALVMSDVYLWDDATATLTVNPARTLPLLPTIDLGPCFVAYSDFAKRMPHVPSMRDLVSLRVEGDVHFTEGVVLRNHVEIKADEGTTLTIPPNSTLDNVSIAGSLTMTSLH